MSKPALGDVFVIPAGDGRAGVGQVVATYGKDAYFSAILDLVLPLDEAAERAAEGLSAPVLFIALSMDAKLHAGHWTVVAQAPVNPAIPLPACKEAVGSATYVEVVDFSGARRRPATLSEAAALPNRKVVAPLRLERALRAALGPELWLEPFDELRVENVVPSASVFG